MKSEYIEIEFLFNSGSYANEDEITRMVIPASKILGLMEDKKKDKKTEFNCRVAVDHQYFSLICQDLDIFKYSSRNPSHLSIPIWFPVANKYEVLRGLMLNSKAAGVLFNSGEQDKGE